VTSLRAKEFQANVDVHQVQHWPLTLRHDLMDKRTNETLRLLAV
jgi:hypothetical protein